MKNLFVIIVLALLATSCKDKDNKTTEEPKIVVNEDANLQYKIYQEAIKRNDMTTAVVALNNFMALDSSKPELLDTLAFIYYDQKNPIAISEVVNKILLSRPNDTIFLQMGAASEESIGKFDEAIQKYNTLYNINKDLRFKYQIAYLNYNKEDFKEGDRLMAEVIADPNSEKSVISLPSETGQPMTLKVKAAAYFTQGVIYAQVGQKDKAVNFFRKTLEIESNFEPAAKYINQLLYAKRR